MRSDRLLLATFAGMVLCSGVRADLKVLDKPLWIFPGQQFRVCLQQPEGSGELKVEVPGTLEMFDTWDQDAVQRYYFRALKKGNATLKFSGKGGELEMPLEVLGWNDVFQPREYKQVALPRIWPRNDLEYSGLKSRRTMHSEEDLAELRAKGQIVGRAGQWLKMADEEIYNIIPGPSVPRTCLIVLGSREANRGIGKGCPVCGMKIYEGRSGFYPWKYDTAKHPWKVICPECGTAFPSNDWRAGDMHSGPFPDDGFGCEPVDPPIAPDGGKWRWPFIAYYHQWKAYMGELTPGIIESARTFAATGDKAYAHKSAIALLRMAEAMVDMSLNLNHRKIANRDGILKWPVGAPLESRIGRLGGSFLYIQCNWGNPRIENAARAWDLIFDQLDGDKELIEFCQTHNHPEIRSIEDFKRFIETGILRVPIQAAMDNAVARNWPQQEIMAANLALCLGTEKTTDVADWLLNVNGVRFALTNLFYRDGAAYESPGYNHGHISRMAGIGVILDELQALHPDICKPPKFVSATKDPKFRQIYDFPLNSGLIGRTYPPVGDAGKGGPSNVRSPAQGLPCNVDDWMIAYRVTKDPRFAQAMYGPNGSFVGRLTDPELKAAAEQAGKELGWQVQVPSNMCDGYGLAILRSGENADQRALWMRYARNLQHAHPDMLTYGIAGLRRELLPELGYPEGWTFCGHWESNWGTHYGTKITGLRSTNFNKAELTTFVGQPPVQVAAAESTAPLGDTTATRQRTIALIDLGPERFYCLTVERVQGGEEHHFSFHGPDGEATAENLSLEAYEGTALGEGLKYQDFSSLKGKDGELSCLAFMREPAKATPQGVWSLDYLLRDQDDVHLRMTNVYPDGGELVVAKGKPPGGKKLYDMTWAVLKSRGEGPLTRQYLGVVEPYVEQAAIIKIERVPVSGGDDDAQFPALAVRVTTDEFVDTIIVQYSAGAEVSAGGITCDGEFGLWREQNGQLHTATLVRGTKLLKDKEGIKLAAAEYNGEITTCDWQGRTITIAPKPADASALVGRHIRITNPQGNSVSYQVERAEFVDGACRLNFALDPRIGEGFVKGCKDGVVTSSIYLKLYPYGYYAGKTLANETGEVLYRLRDVSKYDCLIAKAEGEDVSAAKLQAEFSDLDSDGLSRFVIYDYGPGDTVTMENYATVSRRGPHLLRLQQGGGAEEVTVVVKR